MLVFEDCFSISSLRSFSYDAPSFGRRKANDFVNSHLESTENQRK